MESVVERNALIVPANHKKKPFNNNSEVIAQLIRINPATYSLFFGIGTHAFLDQFLKLWPSRRAQVLPYMSMPSILLAFLGWKIAFDFVRNPHADIDNALMTGNNRIHVASMKRVALATLEGVGVIFPFLLGEIIEVYCKNPKHLDETHRCAVSEATFWEQFFSVPASFAMCYIAWHSINPVAKFNFSKKSKLKKILVSVIDVLTKALLYTRIFQSLVMNIYIMNIYNIPRPIMYEYGAIPAGGMILAGQLFFPRHWQKLEMGIIYAMIASLSLYMVDFLMAERKESSKTHTLWSPILKMLSFPMLFLSGLVFTMIYFKEHCKENVQNLQVVLDNHHDHRRPIITLHHEHSTLTMIEGYVNSTHKKAQIAAIQTTAKPATEKPVSVSRIKLKFSIMARVLEELGLRTKGIVQNATVQTVQTVQTMSLKELLRDERYCEITKEVLKELGRLKLAVVDLSLDDSDTDSQEHTDLEMPFSNLSNMGESVLLDPDVASSSAVSHKNRDGKDTTLLLFSSGFSKNPSAKSPHFQNPNYGATSPDTRDTDTEDQNQNTTTLRMIA